MHPHSPSKDRDYIEERYRQLQDVVDGLTRDATVCSSLVFKGVQATIYNALETYGKVRRERMISLVNTAHDACIDEVGMRRYIHRIRNKLPETESIETIWGWGWELERKSDTGCSSLSAI